MSDFEKREEIEPNDSRSQKETTPLFKKNYIWIIALSAAFVLGVIFIISFFLNDMPQEQTEQTLPILPTYETEKEVVIETTTEPEVIVTGLKIKSLPDKTAYTIGETIDTEGLILSVTYSDGTEVDITKGYELNQSVFTVAGLQQIVITYDNFQDSFNVTVTKPVTINVGDIITFGQYEWICLAKSSGKALIITKLAITNMAFNQGGGYATWEDCSLREWMNGTFYYSFSAEDRAKIVATKIQNPSNPQYGTYSGPDTTDYIFALSMQEAAQYFSTNEARICYPSESAIQTGIWRKDSGVCTWWMRTAGYTTGYGCGVSSDGSLGHHVSLGYSALGVRPAMWISIQ